MQKLIRMKAILLTILIVNSGCENEDARVAQIALEAAQRQAEQNQEMARVNREVAEGTKRLIDGRADADQQWQAMQQEFESQRSQLDTERRHQASARQRDSLLAPVLTTLGVLLVCALPLAVCWQLLVGLGRETHDVAITQLLIDEVVGSSESAIRADPQTRLHSLPRVDVSDEARQARLGAAD